MNNPKPRPNAKAVRLWAEDNQTPPAHEWEHRDDTDEDWHPLSRLIPDWGIEHKSICEMFGLDKEVTI